MGFLRYALAVMVHNTHQLPRYFFTFTAMILPPPFQVGTQRVLNERVQRPALVYTTVLGFIHEGARQAQRYAYPVPPVVRLRHSPSLRFRHSVVGLLRASLTPRRHGVKASFEA